MKEVVEMRPQERVISNNNAVYECMYAGLKSPVALFNAFIKEANLIKSNKHSKKFHEQVSLVCTKFEKAFTENDIDLMVGLYEELISLKMEDILIHF